MHIPTLVFAEGGWCGALKASYRPGPYLPRTAEEFKALAPFAVNAPALQEPESSEVEESEAETPDLNVPLLDVPELVAEEPMAPAKDKPGRKAKA